MDQLERRLQWPPANQPTRRSLASVTVRVAGEIERNAELLAQDLATILQIAERRAEAEIMQNRMDRGY